MKMVFRGKAEAATETIQTPHSENWYQDLKDVPLITLSEKALVGAAVSLSWRMNREDKQVYMEGDKGKIFRFTLCASLSCIVRFVVSCCFERKGGKMDTIPKKTDEELWYHRIAKNFVFQHEEDLTAQTSSGKKRRAPTAATAPKKGDADRAQSSKAKNVRGETKGMRHSSDSWCDYVVVSDSLEGLAPAVVRRPKAEPRDTADIPPSNPDDPIDLESSPERLLRKKVGKRKQTDVEVEGQPVKKVQRKKITRRGNLDAFIAKPALEDYWGREKPADVAVDAEKITSPEAVDSGSGNPQTPEFVARDPEKGKSAQEIPITTSPSVVSGFIPENIEKIPAEDRSSFSDVDKNSPIRPDETLGDYYYRIYSEKNASEIHAPIWNLKKGDTFSDWRVCRDWLQGTFPPGEEQLKAEVESAKKDLELEWTEKAETSRRLAETEEKLENSETARAMVESELEPLKSDMLWLKERGISSVAESVLNSEELDKTVAHLLVAMWNDGYAHGYAECSHHVVNSLKVDWDNSKSATHGVNTEAAFVAAKT
ncbi:hypothetical protein HanOQP8_Chr02g0046881 [Helianthus annuus]|nr:hypothetical protein HanOQP8_Chr02g0046881 [Helianthus annuus]